MALLAVLGERTRVEGWALAGALVVAAESPREVRAAWAELRAADVGVVLLTRAAAAALTAELAGGRLRSPVVSVVPQPRAGQE